MKQEIVEKAVKKMIRGHEDELKGHISAFEIVLTEMYEQGRKDERQEIIKLINSNPTACDCCKAISRAIERKVNEG